jgi:hypothetical protein
MGVTDRGVRLVGTRSILIEDRRTRAPDQTVDDCREAQPLGRRENSAFHGLRLRKQVRNKLTNKTRENGGKCRLQPVSLIKCSENRKTPAFSGCWADVQKYHPRGELPLYKAAQTKG